MSTRLALGLLLPLILFLAACNQAGTDPATEGDSSSSSVTSESESPEDGNESETADDSEATGGSESAAGDDAASETGAAGGAGAEASTPAADGDLAASVNGQPIAMDDFLKQVFQTHSYIVEQGGVDPNTESGQKQLAFLRRQVLDDMINQALMEQAAAERGVSASDEEVAASLDAYIEGLGGEAAFEEALTAAGSTREEAEAMERSALVGRKMLEAIAGDVPETAEFVHARHILCKTAEACQQALFRIESGEDFAALAAEISQDQTNKDKGGDLDWVTRGTLPSQRLEDALFALEPGERSAVVESDFGFHILEMIAVDPARALSEDQRTHLKERALLEWLEETRREADIVIFVEGIEDGSAAGDASDDAG